MNRPNDPISFIANFMLNNKKHMKNLDEFINELPQNQGDHSRDISVVDGEVDETLEEENLEQDMK